MDSMSIALVLENKGESWTFVLLGWLALEILPLSPPSFTCQEFLIVEVARTGVSDLDAGGARRRRAGENPVGLVGAVVLAGIDIDEELRLALLYGNERKLGRVDNFEVVTAWAWRCFFCWQWRRKRTKPKANKPKKIPARRIRRGEKRGK